MAIDPARCTRSREEADASPLRCPDPEAETAMIARIDEARSNGDTVGGVFEVVVHGAPVGLGSYVHWDRRLDAALAGAVMSINIVKGVELGLGFEQTRRFGSAVHDVIEGRRDDGTWVHRTNNAGGLTGGVTNGEPIVVRGAVKPISTLARPLPTADLVTGEPVEKAHYERSDISVVPAAGVIGEAMVMLTLARFVLEKTGGDSMPEVLDNLHRAQARMAAPIAAPAAGDGSGGHAAGSAAAAVRVSTRRPSPTPARPGRAGTTERRWTSCSSGCPGSGKSAVGRRMASRHGALFIDLDDQIERVDGRSIPEIFEQDGEAGFRRLERAAVASLGPPDTASGVRRVISPGGGAIIDPRNRWDLYRGRLPVWLDVRAEVLTQRLRRSPTVRPLIQGADPLGRVRQLAAGRAQFYGAATRVNAGADAGNVVDAVEQLVASGIPSATTLLRASTTIGDVVIGEGIAARAVGETLRRLAARRAILVSEPGAWTAVGAGIAADLEAAGWPVETIMLPAGEDGEAAVGHRGRGASARGPAGRAPGATRGDRRRRPRGPGRVPRGDLPARRALDRCPDDARRPGGFVHRREDRRGPARGQEPRRRVLPPGCDRPGHLRPEATPRAAAPGGAGRGREDGGAGRRGAVRDARAGR